MNILIKNRHIVRIILQGNEFVDLYIYTQFAAFSQLNSLEISGFRLSYIPSWISKFSELQTLIFHHNSIVTIPEWIFRLRLRVLDLSFNHFFTLSDSLANCSQLVDLNLASNSFQTFPKQVLSLKSLETLNLNLNLLKSIPSEIGELSNLHTLDLGGNILSEIPEEMGALVKLSTLKLNQNRLCTLPSQLTKLKDLVYLDLSNNPLLFLPTSFEDLYNLEYLNINATKFAYFPFWVSNLPNLKTLEFLRNDIVQSNSTWGRILFNLIDLYHESSAERILLIFKNIVASQNRWSPTELIDKLRSNQDFSLMDYTHPDLAKCLGVIEGKCLHCSTDSYRIWSERISGMNQIRLSNLKKLWL
jgi:Leucine-rich repeat (LRR) protein